MVQIVEEKLVKEVKAYEEYISLGLEAREAVDGANWLLGDLALSLEKDYGEDTIGKYASEIGVAKKSLMNYRTVAGAFNPELRTKYKKLSFSHFKTLAGLPKPEAWLEKADDNNWSVEMLSVKVKEAYQDVTPTELTDQPPEVFRCPECGLWRLEGLSIFESCKGHYVYSEKGKVEFK